MAGEFQMRELSGSAFKNDRKTQDNHPDYRGSCMIEGKEYWISIWIKENHRGKWLSMAYQPKENRPPSPPPIKAPSRPSFDDLGDDIPF